MSKYFLYDPETKEFDSEYTPPLNHKGNAIIPTNATNVAPGVIGDNEVAVFDDNDWVKYPDFRGSILFDKSNGFPVVIEEYGPIPDALTDVAPETDDRMSFDDNTGKWIVDDASLASEVIREITKLANNKRQGALDILAGNKITKEKEVSYEVRENLASIVIDTTSSTESRDDATATLSRLAAIKGVTVEEYALFTVNKAKEIRDLRNKLYILIDVAENKVNDLVDNGDISNAILLLAELQTLGDPIAGDIVNPIAILASVEDKMDDILTRY